MTPEQANKTVADAISSAMSHCKAKSVDEQTLRTGLLTITIANFVNRIGRQNTIELFSAIPGQIQAGTFDRYVDQSVEQKSPKSAPQARPGPMPSHFIPPQASVQPDTNPKSVSSAQETNPTNQATSSQGLLKRRINL